MSYRPSRIPPGICRDEPDEPDSEVAPEPFALIDAPDLVRAVAASLFIASILWAVLA